MSMIRQTILIRTDLQFPSGLLATQVAHIHALVKTAVGRELSSPLINEMGNSNPSPELMDWAEAPYVFVHGVPNKEVLLYFVRKCEDNGVIVMPWTDTVYLDIGGEDVPFKDVLVGSSLGPCDSDKIKMVIGKLGPLE